MAVAKARLFRFEDAKVDFLKAYQRSGVEVSLFYYYCIVAMLEGIQTASEELASFEVSDLVRESFENRFAGISDEFRYTSAAAGAERIDFLLKNDRPEEAKWFKERFVAKLRQNFRKELYMDENLLVTNLPIGYTINYGPEEKR
jgi:hypothetical protein